MGVCVCVYIYIHIYIYIYREREREREKLIPCQLHSLQIFSLVLSVVLREVETLLILNRVKLTYKKILSIALPRKKRKL